MFNDVTNHPDFSQRLKNWKSGENGCVSTGSAKPTECTNATDIGCCLNDSEIACYSNYILNNARSNLDADLREIYQPETSRASTFQSNLEATMLTGVVWAMLGTTVLYYAFTKI
jgi:hypothetical protein